jgi:hypothetical protein
MDDRTVNRIINILESDPDFFVPIKKLWLLLQGEGLALEIELDDFHSWLESDARFELIFGVDHTEGFKDDPALVVEMDREMEALGFYSGPRVKLVSREMTADDVFAGLARSLSQMNEALQSAWEARPESDRETEDQMLEILALGQKLDREIRGLIDPQEQDKS